MKDFFQQTWKIPPLTWTENSPRSEKTTDRSFNVITASEKQVCMSISKKSPKDPVSRLHSDFLLQINYKWSCASSPYSVTGNMYTVSSFTGTHSWKIHQVTRCRRVRQWVTSISSSQVAVATCSIRERKYAQIPVCWCLVFEVIDFHLLTCWKLIFVMLTCWYENVNFWFLEVRILGTS